jgi:hypothetical protein
MHRWLRFRILMRLILPREPPISLTPGFADGGLMAEISTGEAHWLFLINAEIRCASRIFSK